MSCPHEDYPCCGCDPDMLTEEQIQERLDAEEYDPFMTDAEADADVLASAGMGTDEDYCGVDMHDIDFEDRLSGGGDFEEF